MKLDPPPSLVELVKDNDEADSIWKQWFNNLQVWVLENMSKDFFFEVAAGNVSGHSSYNAFGRNTNVGSTEEHLWEYGGTYTYSTTADIAQIASDSASDTVTIDIVGLDTDWNEQTVSVTLTGTTPVTIAPAFIRIFYFHNSGGTNLVGNVSIVTSGGTFTAGVPDTASTVRGFMESDDNMSDMAMYTIPADKTGYIVFGKTSASSGKDVTVKFIGRAFGGVFMVKHVLDIYSANYDYFFKAPMKMPEKTDLEVRAMSGAAGTKVSAAFDIILVDN